MVQIIPIEDQAVDVEDIKKFKLAFLMQFFVQHKQRFHFPRLRLQDLYQHILIGSDAVPLCDCVARILRFLRHRDPSVCIANVDEALDIFVSEKRTTHRQALQAVRGGRSAGELDAPSRAILLEHLIECVYDEHPELSFNTVFNAPKEQVGDSVSAPPDDDSLLIKVGQDAAGSSYYYMDDLRLYRETPQSGLSSHWSVAVGPTTHQWTSFIASLERSGDEADLCNFLQHELFALVQGYMKNPCTNKCNDELDSTHLVSKEAAELVELQRMRGQPPIIAQHSKSPTQPLHTSSNAALPLAECSEGCNASVSNSVHSISTCPLTPPNPTPSVLLGTSQTLTLTSECVVDTKECLTAPNTPGALAAFRSQQPVGVEAPRSISPQSCKASLKIQNVRNLSQLEVPLQRPASGPSPSVSGTQMDAQQPHSAPPFPTPSSMTTTSSSQRVSLPYSITSEAGCDAGVSFTSSAPNTSTKPTRPQPGVVCSSPNMAVSQSSIPSRISTDASLMMSCSSPHILVFTTDLANEAAIKFAHTRLRITMFHAMHPAVHQFMVHNGYPPSVSTQEQLEKRKSKMAQLEKIQSKLTKSKMASTPGAATVAAMQQQQMYASGGASGPVPHGPSSSAPLDQISPPPQQSGMSCVDIQQQTHSMMVSSSEGNDFDRVSWMQQQKHHPGSTRDPESVHFPYSVTMDPKVAPVSTGGGGGGGGGGPSVMVVPPNNACGYSPTPNRFCSLPTPPPPRPTYKWSCTPEMAPPEQQFWDQQQTIFEQQQLAMLMQQHAPQPAAATTPMSTSGGRSGGSGRSGLGKKRKSTGSVMTATNRSTPIRPPQPPPIAPFSNPQRLPQPSQPSSGARSGGFGSTFMGPLRGPGPPFQAITGDPMNSGYMSVSYRADMTGGGAPYLIDQTAYPSLGSSGTALAPASSNHQQHHVPPGGYHPTDGLPVSSSSPGQHLTSASLASLARLSQLSGSEGPFCAVSNSAGPHQSPSFGACSRIGSAPDMFGFPSNGTGSGILSNSESDPNSLYSSNPVGAAYNTSQPIPPHPSAQGRQRLSSPLIGQPAGFHGGQMSLLQHQQQGPSRVHSMGRSSDQIKPQLVTSCGFSSGDQLRPVSEPCVSCCLASSCDRTICPTSTAPATPASTTLPIPQHSPSIQVNNTFYNAQLNVQQMNYQQVNGISGADNAQMQINFMQQQQQQQRSCYGTSGCQLPQPPRFTQKLDSRVPPQLPTNVQITPKTPHTIQYLPSSGSTSTTATTPTTAATASVGQYPLHAAGAASNEKLQLPATLQPPQTPLNQNHHQPALNAIGGGTGIVPTVTENRGTSIHPKQQQRTQKRNPLPPLQQQQQITAISTPTANDMLASGVDIGMIAPEMASLPDELYTGGPTACRKYPTAFTVPVVESHQVQQTDNTNPFDFPQGATTYHAPLANSTKSVNQLPGSYRDPPQLQYPSSSSTPSGCAITLAVPFRVDSAPPLKMIHPSPQMYMNDVPYQQQQQQQQQQQRWRHQMMSGVGGDFYLQQQSPQLSNNSAVMMPPHASQQQYYMSSQAGTLQIPQSVQQQQQPQQQHPQPTHSSVYPTLL